MTVKIFMLACLPVVVAGMVWLLLGKSPSPASPGSTSGEVPTLVAADSSGRGHDGIIQGAVEMGLAGYDSGRSYSFGAPDSWVQVQSAPDLNPVAKDFLLTAWVNLTAAPEVGGTWDIVRKGLGYTVTGEYKLEVLAGGLVSCTAKDNNGRLAVAINQQVNVADGAWHRIGCARVGGQWSVLVDATVGSVPVTLGSVSNTVALAIGSKYGREYPRGRIDDVRLTIRSMKGPVQDDYATVVSALEQQPPSGWWRLDEAATSVAGR